MHHTITTAAEYAKVYLDAFENDALTQGVFHSERDGRQLAHHAAVIFDGREIPSGMVVDHTCRNRLCVNPRHLRVVTPRTNTLENSEAPAAINARKTHCIHGHALTGDNLIIRKRSGLDCRSCLRARQARSRKRLADGMTAALSRVEAE